MATLTARVAQVASDSPARIALVEGTRHLDYGGLWQQARSFAALLRGIGLQHGERLVLALPNCIGAVVATYGGWLAGAIVVPLDPRARERDFLCCIEHCGARVVVHGRGHRDMENAIAASTTRPAVIAIEPLRSLPQGDCSVHPSDMPAPKDPALILYTSGTTGTPKGVVLTHANLLANAVAVVSYLALSEDDSVLSMLQFNYAYGASVLHTHLISGARVVLESNLVFPHLIAETMARERVTGFSGVASSYALLLRHGGLEAREFPALRYLTQAGDPMPPKLADQVRMAFPGAGLYLMYGQTEATSRISQLPPELSDAKPGSVGIPIPGVELRVLGDDGATAPAGQIGEVLVRGPGVMAGYWRAPEATAVALRDGWLHTGDLGHLDDDGFLYLTGRRSDMIKTGAHRVHPADVEHVIAEIDATSEVAVVGVDDALLGQVLKAYVVPSMPNVRDAAAIRAHCRSRLPLHKVPRHIEFVESLPRTYSGKIQRAQFAHGASRP